MRRGKSPARLIDVSGTLFYKRPKGIHMGKWFLGLLAIAFVGGVAVDFIATETGNVIQAIADAMRLVRP